MLNLAELGKDSGEDSQRSSEADDIMSSSDEPLPLEVARFIATGSGVKWLADTLNDWPAVLTDARGKLETTRDRINRAPHHLNAFVVGEYKKLVRSEMGKRLINRAHLPEEAVTDPLSVPLYVVEDIVRLRIRQLLSRNWRCVAWRVCTRASLMCAAVHLLKVGAKRLARGRPRAEKAVGYVCDVLLPTGFYGPLIGCSMVVFNGVMELVDKQ